MNKKLWKLMLIGALIALPACQQKETAEKNTPVEESKETAPVKEEKTTEKKQTEEKLEEPVGLEKRAFTEFEAQNLEGETVNQEVFKDKKLTMINIWGTFCGPCIKEMPDLGQLNKEYADKGFQVVGVVVDVLDQDLAVDNAQLEKAKEMVETTKAEYLHIIPTKELVENKLIYTQVIPETIFVDSTGQQIGEPIVGSKSKTQWSGIIDEKLAEVQ